MPSSQFHCRFPGCTSSYRRKEHLHRHEAQHSGSLARTCALCNRSFSRSDTLRRHVRRDHEHPHRQTARAAQACRQCRSAKVRCRGGAPCAQCRLKDNPCVFDDPVHEPSSSQESLVATGQPAVVDAAESEDAGSTDRIQQYVLRYFVHFHPHWPVLHRSTFSIAHEPPLLVQAVLMIGLWVSRTPSAQQAALDLHGKLGLSILAQKVVFSSSSSSFSI
ncbi:hypothetical protein BDV25DRAFT_162772 [Aspergillus avenaceus]|uniref:C2H2 type zinc finger domain protein n=1 Tax=Aspergillus avenaceus TaxID=36643 RepID=A0A5N6TIX7_ASPAV|nr:hypothetical protein BDV25DRAFT_162772 [Aspergillus avenaceus]